MLLGRQPQNPFWSHLLPQPPHPTTTPPIKLQFPSILPCFSELSLLGFRFHCHCLQASGASRTIVVLLTRLPTSTTHLDNEASQSTSLLTPSECSVYRVSPWVRPPQWTLCTRDCTEFSKQDHKAGIISFKLQTWELRERATYQWTPLKYSSLDLSDSKEHASPTNPVSWISLAIKAFMDHTPTEFSLSHLPWCSSLL